MDRTVPSGAALLLDFIRKTEVGRTDRASYDVIYGHNQNKLSKPITSMTIGDLVDAQADFTRRFKSSASGGYQFMRATLQGLATELGLSGKQMFDPDLQDRLGYHLLKRRGYEAFMAGKISMIEFARRLAMEWASFPVLAKTLGGGKGKNGKLLDNMVDRGQSYYAGDPLNKALVKPEAIEVLLKQVKAAGSKVVEPFPVKPVAADKVQQVQKADDADISAEIVTAPLPEKPEAGKPVTRSMRFLSWVASGGGAAMLPFVDWRVQFFIAAGIMGFAVYAIYSMPQIKAKLTKFVEAL